MYTCPKCKRKFEKDNQSHMCVVKEVDDLFVKSTDELVMAYDTLRYIVMEWQPNYEGAAKHSVVFTNKKAWLIVKPMKSALDVKFYHDQVIDSGAIHSTSEYGGKFAYHLRIRNADDINREVMDLLKMGYDFGMGTS